MVGISFDEVTVRYTVYNGPSQSLRRQLVSIGTGGRLASEAGNTISITALENVSFRLNEGDRVGLIGHNGAGKTTLLRTIAGIFKPISGVVKRSGRVSTIIELGAGMDHELTGYENILRMGMLQGASLSEMNAATASIAVFSDLGDFLKMPVRTYSSGMLMRLMFAVATYRSPEILVVDEMFGTGDSDFKQRAEDRMHQMMTSASIMVFASHSHDLIRRYCNRLFRLEHGTVSELAADSLFLNS